MPEKTQKDIDDNYSLDEDGVALAIQHKIESRAAQGYTFHCLVTDSREKRAHKPKSGKRQMNDLEFHLRMLHKAYNQGKIQDGTRVQLLVKNGAHWSAVDLQFSTQGVSAIILDAAGDPRWIETLKAINKVFPQSTIFASKGHIQYDMSNCAIFSMDHVFNISKIEDIHEYLQNNRDRFTETEDSFSHPYLDVPMTELPPTLVTNMQRIKNLEEHYLKENPQLRTQPLGDKQQTLPEIFESQTKQTGRYITNNRIETKREKYKAKASEKLSQTPGPSRTQIARKRRATFFKTLSQQDQQNDTYRKYRTKALMAKQNDENSPEQSSPDALDKNKSIDNS